MNFNHTRLKPGENEKATLETKLWRAFTSKGFFIHTRLKPGENEKATLESSRARETKA